MKVIKTLRESGKLTELLNLVLKGPEPIKSYNEIKPVILLKVFKDFFYINDLSTGVGMTFEMILSVLEDEKIMGVLTSYPMIMKTLKELKAMTGIGSSPSQQTEISVNTTTSEEK